MSIPAHHEDQTPYRASLPRASYMLPAGLPAEAFPTAPKPAVAGDYGGDWKVSVNADADTCYGGVAPGDLSLKLTFTKGGLVK